VNQRPSHAAPHVGWFDEQPFELVNCTAAGDDDREPNRCLIVGYRDADPAVFDEGLRQLDRIGIRREPLAIFDPDVGGSALQCLEYWRFPRGSVTDPGHGRRVAGRWPVVSGGPGEPAVASGRLAAVSCERAVERILGGVADLARDLPDGLRAVLEPFGSEVHPPMAEI
jgi:hypothetical protein